MEGGCLGPLTVCLVMDLKFTGGRGVAIWKMKTLWMSGLCSIGLVMDPKFTGGGRWHVEDVNSVDARVVEQAIICWGHFGSRYKSGCGFDPAIHSFLPPTTLGEQSLCYCRHKAVSMCDTKPTTGLSHLGGGL